MASYPDDWSRLKEIFAHARALPLDARAAYLTEACRGDESVRHEVESLLASDARAKSFLEASPRQLAGDATETLDGRCIGAYQIGSRIGAGGMGEVYEGRDTILERQVAIKVLLPIVAHDSERLTRFRREAQLLASLNHPHIAQIHGFEHADDVWALVMELVPGPTLAQRIGDAPLPIAEALGIAAQIAGALEAAHEQGIIHRDLKPSNIKVREDGTVKVLDFGLATALDQRMPRDAGARRSSSGSADATQTGAIFGTPAYMSPEQARGQAVDRRADLWAFGCILYEMLTGRRAFEGDSARGVLDAVESTEPEWTRLPEKTPPAITTLVRRCLEKSRARRLDSATAVRLEIDDALATLSSRSVVSSKQPPEIPGVHQRTADVSGRRTRRLLLAVVGAVGLVAAGGIWQAWQRDYFWRNPLAGAAVHRLTDFAGEETDAAISPDGKFFTFLSDRDGRFDAWIGQIDTGELTNITNGRFEMMNNPNARMIGFSGDGAQVWLEQLVSARPLVWTSWIRPLLGGTPRRFVEGGLEPTWSADGNSVIYHTNDLGDPLFLADKDGSNPRRIFVGTPGVHGHYPTWSPDGRFVYLVMGSIATDELDIWRIPLAADDTSATPERVTFHNARIANPAWLDDRTLIYSATAEDGSGNWLYAIDVEHRIPHRVSSGIAEQYMSVAVSNTQPRRVVTTIAVPTAQLWQVPIADRIQAENAATRLPVSNVRSLSPRFAPTYLAFLSSRGGAEKQGLWKLEDGETTEIWRGEDGGVVTPPAISRDGRLICFAFRKGGRSSLYVMNANGTNVRTIGEGLEVRGAATWSADGNWVAVAGNRGDGTRIFKVPVDGGAPIPLANRLSVDPVWSPDGRLILYSEQQQAGQFEVRAMTPEQTPVSIAALQIAGFYTAHYRFLPEGNALIVLEGVIGASQNFFKVDLATGERRQLTDFDGTYVIRNFDVSPDGTHIVFDRWRQHADIAMLTLAR